ncbi:hypothetical protein Axi01nite_41220 [Actinoplanes xinjiangensis]|nr:hypothetical protein Axi01nite_41220 [Actinoplanes xinjiangensis]
MTSFSPSGRRCAESGPLSTTAGSSPPPVAACCSATLILRSLHTATSQNASTRRLADSLTGPPGRQRPDGVVRVAGRHSRRFPGFGEFNLPATVMDPSVTLGYLTFFS